MRYVTYGAHGLGEFPISRLTFLQELNNYRVQGSMGNKISAIKSLRGLREILLYGLENVESHKEVINAKLNEKTNLVSLSLIWSSYSQNRIDDLVLDHLEPHGNIRELRIHGCKGLKVPFWIENLSVKNLVSLSLSECINWEHLPSLGELVLLTKLSLLDLPKLEQIDHSLDMSSRSSMELLPPNLHTLEVKQCQELRELPILPPSLVTLHIEGTRLTTLPMMGKTSSENTPSQLVRISVIDCPFLTSLEGSLFEQKLYIGTLLYLRIKNCILLESAFLPFEEMYKLEELCIQRCPKLRTMRDAKSKLLPSSLRILTMGQCGDLELPLLGSLKRLTNLFSLRLDNCSLLESLPSAEVFNTSLKSLRDLHLLGCENLSSLGGLGSLEWLEISKCSKLVVAGLSLAADVSGAEEEHLVKPSRSQQIDMLHIDSPSLLLAEPLNAEPLKSLCHTHRVTIEDEEMKSLPEGWLLQNHASLRHLVIMKARSLESLPPSMPGLSSLQRLAIFGAKQLQSLPDLPSSLQNLLIWGCHPDLEKKIRELASPERNNICHIHHVGIGTSTAPLSSSLASNCFSFVFFFFLLLVSHFLFDFCLDFLPLFYL